MQVISDSEKENNMSALALKMTKDERMSPELDAAEFSRLSYRERIAKCREMAAEAERLAAGARGEVRASYFELSGKWTDLANEMESASEE